MPTDVTMANSREPDQPGSGPSNAGLTPEELAKVVRRLETGFYERPDVRDQIARRALDDLAQ
jgi:hypothetical protein